ncbi:GspE/PulE family protein [Mitsuaria sp. WAJ17]|uniref:GspE/PulE family protein n=1 Tax=Mitsuaria sp. WAJ17 TaxID=2761452 RepID=UPI001C7EDC9C|nr:GspE/PulE family protein [Mitsuaria sp. WAJ17]
MSTHPQPPLDEALLHRARAHCQAGGGTMLEAVAHCLALDLASTLGALAGHWGLPMLSMRELQSHAAVFDWIPFAECAQRGCLPLRSEQGVVLLVLLDPWDVTTEEWAVQRCADHGAEATLALALPDDVSAFLAQQERALRALDGFDGGDAEAGEEEVAAVITLASINEDSNPVVKLVNSTIYDALKLQASDIHMECDAGWLRVLYRIDGVLVPITEVQSAEMAEQAISRIKVMAELDIAERRVPQDGRFKVRINGRDIDFRVSVMPNIFGEDAVLRLLDRQALTEEARTLTLDRLGLDGEAIETLRRLSGKPHGMVLVTGPTGSGKTTTLYAAITEIHTGRDKIVTIEDPVEYRLPRVLQIPVNEKKGLTFARGLRSILRHDPDKIMVGEIRDDETAQIAVQAALTGHLVFTTVHANNVFDVLGRFLHMGVDAYSFAAALNGILAQRLIRQNCPHCSEPEQPSRELLSRVGLLHQDMQGWQLRAGRGCGHCRGVGYKGRKAVAELLVLDDRLREMIADRAPVSALRAYAAERQGWVSLQERALQWVAQGHTTLEEWHRVAG